MDEITLNELRSVLDEAKSWHSTDKWRDDGDPAHRSAWERMDRKFEDAINRIEQIALIPTHYAENINYAALVLEGTGSIIDAREALVLFRVVELMRK